MSKYNWHSARDRRVYNGALCSDMRKESDSIAALKALLPPNALLTYFPLEGKWCCSLKDFRGQMFYELSFEPHIGDSLVTALERLDVITMEEAA